MQVLTFFIIFGVSYAIFDWIIRKTNIHNRLFGNSRVYGYKRIIFILVLILLTVSIEYMKQLLKDEIDQHNYISTIIGGFLGSIYVNFIPLMFRRSNSKF